MAHILFLTHWFPTTIDPVSGIFIREHARAVALFHKVSIVHIIGINRTGTLVDKVTKDHLTVYHLSYPQPKLPKTGWLYRFATARRIIKELIHSDDPPDIIHANVYSSSDLGYIFSRLYRKPAVMSEHASVYPRNLLTNSQRAYYRFFMNRLKLIMPVSRDLQYHMERAGFRGPFRVIPNAVDTGLFHPSASRPINQKRSLVLLNVAMLQPIKGTVYLLEAFAQIRKLFPNSELWIVGEGPERSRLQAMAEEFQILPYISFLGLKTKKEVADLMRLADLFVLTSLWETQSVTLIEAMASGLPVIAPAVGGIPEIVQPTKGVLFEPGNVTSLTEQLFSVMEHLDHYSPAENARNIENTFGLQAIGKQFSEVYEQMLNEA